MGDVIGIANQKGGVGKTTLTIHLAVGLARRGKKVIVVDADPQGNLTSWLLDGQTSDGTFRLLIAAESPVRTVQFLRKWDLGLLPGNYRTGEAMTMLAAVGRLAEIPSRIRPLAGVADYALMDMPPSRSPGFTELLSACDWIVVPTQLERLSLEGVGLMAQAAMELRKAGQGPRLLGIVPNMTRARTNEHKAQMEELVNVFGPVVWPPLPLTIKVTEAASYGSTLYDRAPGENVTRQMELLVQRTLEATNGHR